MGYFKEKLKTSVYFKAKNALKNERIKNGYSLREASELLGFSYSKLSKIENGKVLLKKEEAKKIDSLLLKVFNHNI